MIDSLFNQRRAGLMNKNVGTGQLPLASLRGRATTKLLNVQVMRAFAALAVVEFHSGYRAIFMPHSVRFGVSIFFVISGFIMSRICFEDTRYFTRRRIIRIVPLYWLFTLAIFLVALKAPALLRNTHANVPDLMKSLFFIPFRKNGGLIEPVLFLGWTLNLEMYFYAVVALCITACRRWSARYAPVVAAALIVAVLALLSPYRNSSLYAEFYSSPIILDFVWGIACFLIYNAVSTQQVRRLRFLITLGLVVTLLGGAILSSRLTNEALGTGWYVDVLSAFAVLFTTLLSRGGTELRSQFLTLLGDSSYALYLVHPYVLAFVAMLGKRHPLLHSETSLVGLLIGNMLVIALAIVIHLWVELPVVNSLNRRFGGSRRSVVEVTPAMAYGR